MIAGAYLRPGERLRAMLARPPGEARLMAKMFAACLAAFLAGLGGLGAAAQQAASLPGVADTATGADEVLMAMVMARLFAALFLGPLMLYALAALSHLVARAFGGQGSWFGARLALAEALWLSIPFVLLGGLAGLPGLPAGLASAVSLLTFAVFLWLWGAHLSAAESRKTAPDPVS